MAGLQPLIVEYFEIPIVTRFYISSCVLTTLAVQLDIITPFQLYFNPTLILYQYQIWRLFTTFLFFGTMGFSFFFNMIFAYKYCRMLEEGSFRGRSSDFVMLFVFGGTIMVVFAFYGKQLFLGQAFTIMLVYVWSRRNPFIRMNLFGIMNFPAPYLPWVLLGFSVILGNTIWIDLMGMAVGHIYYFLEDVFPNQRGGFKMLKTPRFLQRIFDEVHEYTPLNQEGIEDRPGGFDFREQPPAAQPAADNNDDAQPAEENNENNINDNNQQ